MAGRTPRRDPRNHVVRGTWPHAVLDGNPGAIYAQAVAANLSSAITERRITVAALAVMAGVSERALRYTLLGATYPDLASLASIETALGSDLLTADRRGAILA